MRGLERGEVSAGAGRDGFPDPPTSSSPSGAARHPTQEDDGGGLGTRVRRGLGLSLANTLLSRVGTFAMGIALARLLAPDEFGVYAAALVVQNLLLAVNDLGAAAALVRHPGSGRSAVRPLLPTAWTLSVLWGLVGFLLCLLSAPLLAEALGSPEATGVIRLMSVNVVLDGFAAVPGALLTRELAQARRLVADVSGMALNLAVTGSLAVLGAGAWSLAGGNIAGTALVVVLLVVLAGIRPRFGLHRAHAATITRCGAAMLGSSTVLVLAQATPQLVTGTLLGASALGLLYLASNVANWPAAIVTGTVERVALATFSRVRERGGDLSRAVSGVFGLVGVVVLPGGIGLAVLAEPLVLVLYGPDWSPAATALSGLAVAAVARVVSELVFNLMVAAGALASSVGLQLAWLLALVPLSCVGAWWWGLTGVAWAQAFVAATVALPLQVWGAHRVGVRVRELARGVWPAAVLGLVLLFALLALRLAGLAVVVELVVGVVLVGAVVTLGGLCQYRRCRGLLDEPSPATR